MARRKLRRVTSALLALVFSIEASAAWVAGVRHHATPDNTRVVFDLAGELTHAPSVTTLRGPDRLVIDLPAEGYAGAGTVFSDSSVVRELRTGKHDGFLRFVLDLDEPVTFTQLQLPAGADQNARLVFDLKPLAHEVGGDLEAIRAAWSALDLDALRTAPLKGDENMPSQAGVRDQQVVIAIDAGHGGRDPGAIGRGGTYEKTVVLAMSQQLKQMIDQEPGFTAILTRTGDYYLGLRQRVEKARKANADLFVSIHADAVDRVGPQGSSIYALSRRGATSTTAQWLAQADNDAFLANDDGPLYLAEEDPVTRSTLLDLSLGATVTRSVAVGSTMLAQMGEVNRLHKPSVELANFAVLRSPDMPSVLVETGFISTPEEERRLLDPHHQKRLMEAVKAGILHHFSG